ncbi:nitrous oxide reductase accessory protein NosL [Natronorubrum sulfidifaciens]|uniref:Lipoprotein n=1 Tax=Natronorubrum sulfidifaciens JCM 14089 TaxID=1230460 RepID=L9W481_9EURY|nr:nitrous oxide reductase accessory protein NosL [Natronorubrum sulfidifaciens]ELY44270.1 hypothetical protein C495_10224 [Natronorubrum sulfidifaciens JCM 14089]
MRRSHGVSRSRRRLLAACATGVGGVLAGCSDDDGGDPNVADPDAGFDFTVEHPVDEPKEFSDDQMCGVCSMTVTDYPERNCQVAHEDGVGMMCCSPGCMFAYYAEPTHFGGSEAEIVGVWVTEFEMQRLIDGFDAVYVLEHNEQRADDPMRIDPRPYGNRSTALEYVDEYDDLSEDDIVSLSAVDTDVARIYRSARLP